MPDETTAPPIYKPFPPIADWLALSAEYQDDWLYARNFLAERREASSEEDFEREARVATRMAAVDTAALEGLYTADRGFTVSVAKQTAAWESQFAAKGQQARRLFDAQLEALDWVIDAATQERPITEVWIRELHQKLCGPQETYKS